MADSLLLTEEDWRVREEIVYRLQIEDKACTICVHVRRGGKICKECLASRTMKNWENAYERNSEPVGGATQQSDIEL